MNHQFKPGDLALITHANNAGRVVEVTGAHHGPCTIKYPGGRWQIVPTGVVAYSVKADALNSSLFLSNRMVVVGEMAYGPRWLMPLRGDFAPAEQKSSEVLA